MKCGTRRIWTGGFVRRGKAILPHFAVSLLGCVLLSMPVRVHGVQEAQTSLRFPDVRIMVVISEKHYLLDTPLRSPAAETEVIRIFTEAGYKVVDQVHSEAIRNSPDLEAIMRNPTGPEARAAATRNGADILIVGEAHAETAGYTDLGFLVRARVEGRAVIVPDGVILASQGFSGGASDPGEITAGKIALENAARRLGEYLQDKVGERVGGPRPPSRPRQVRIAVLPFESGYSRLGFERDVPDLIGAEMLKHPMFSPGKPDAYILVDRDTMQKVLDEIGLQVKDVVDNPGRMAQQGGLLPADYLIVGRITQVQKPDLLTEAQVKVLVKIIDLKAHILAQKEVLGKTRWRFPEEEETAIRRAAELAARGVVKEVLNDQFLPRIGEIPLPGHCGTWFEHGQKFCTVCGKPLEGISLPSLRCKKCQAPLKPTDRFCGKCGEPVPRKPPLAS